MFRALGVCWKERVAYYRIAKHYKYIMQQLFDCRYFDRPYGF